MDADDGYLEGISDKIRRGEPVDFADALAAIDYQARLRALKKKRLWCQRVIRFFKTNAPPNEI